MLWECSGDGGPPKFRAAALVLRRETCFVGQWRVIRFADREEFERVIRRME